MFSRSAMAFGVLASVELLVFRLAVGRFGVLLLLAVVAALSVFGATFLYRQSAGMVPGLQTGLFGGLLLLQSPSRRPQSGRPQSRNVVDVYSTMRDPQGFGINPQQLQQSCADYV